MEHTSIDTNKQNIDLNRSIVLHDYQSAELKNKESFNNNDIMASREYIFPNQKKMLP